MRFTARAAVSALSAASAVAGYTLDINSPSSIASVAEQIATTMVDTYYIGNDYGQAPGTVVQPYYWYECGDMLCTLIDYWYYTNDTQFNSLITEALLFQTGPDNDYMPANQTKDEGNDDQIYWGWAVMQAAEYDFPNPPDTSPQWISLAEGVLNSQIARWDNATCNGGLRWQIYTFNNGWNYKNMPSNGGFMNLAARLYAYTGNQTYADWVYSAWDWLEGVGMISNYEVYDGVTPSENCTSVDHDQWSYSAGMVMNTACVMYYVSNQDAMWRDRCEGIWNATTTVFFDNNKVMLEAECEASGNCDDDEKSFKSTFARFVTSSVKWAPFLYDQVKPYLQASAVAAAEQCDGNPNGTACGMRWTLGTTWDGTTGLGQELSALEVIQSNLMKNVTSKPVNSTSGGISKGNATYGSGGDPNPTALSTITTGDRAGAGILTAVVILFTLAGAWWVLG